MNEELTRRAFLKAVGVAAAGLAGARLASAQEDEEKKDEEKEKDEPKDDDLFGDSLSGEEEEARACPQCGALMYRQGNTWTCDVCGYSYVE